MNLVKLLVVLAAALAGCHGSGAGSEVPVHDGNEGAGAPPPPALGAQIDRMGRPAITSSLIAVFAADGAAKTAQKDAYNQAPDPATWKTTMLPTNVTIERELEANLAVFDAIDNGLAIPGCGNALSYVRPPSATSYQNAADLLADDQLYVDTSKTTCTVYLALEIEQASAGSSVHYACGGRMLKHDVIDVTYSVLAAGLAGLDPANNFAPKLHDGVAPHPDVKDTFPFLGAPH